MKSGLNILMPFQEARGGCGMTINMQYIFPFQVNDSVVNQTSQVGLAAL
ncbi:MAG: hypothetical protein GY820_19805 [Gammaproteobacteria bacterium]|nr:hypothetical protein [Gammaproteobacteria bacterium]